MKPVRFQSSMVQSGPNGPLSARNGTSCKRKLQLLTVRLPGIIEIAAVRIAGHTSSHSARPTELNQFDTFPVKWRRNLHGNHKQRAGILLVNQPKKKEVLEQCILCSSRLRTGNS